VLFIYHNGLIFVLSITENESLKADFRELASNDTCLEMGLLPKVYKKRAAWSVEEDLMLEAQHHIHGSHFSKMDMPNRTPDELRDRWRSPYRVLSSDADESQSKRRKMDQDDDVLIRTLVNNLPMGAKIPWNKFQKEHFPNRKSKEIKNRWNRYLKPPVDSATVSSVSASVAVSLTAEALATEASATIPLVIEASATVALVAMPSATMPSVVLPLPFMTPGVDGAVNDDNLLGDTVIVFKGNFESIDPSPTLAVSKLKAGCESFGAKVMRNITFKTSKFIFAYIYACDCSTHHTFVGSFQLIYFLEKGLINRRKILFALLLSELK
jgi:hypothetical protein